MKKIALLFCLLLIFAGASRLLAHGGGEIQIANAAVGPYEMTAWLNPPQPQVGETIHITVGLAEPPRDTPVLDAEVLVRITAAAAPDPVLVTSATTAASVNKLFYETDFALDQEGEYAVSFVVNGPVGGGEAAFAMKLAPASPVNWLSIGLVALGLVTVATIYRNFRKQNHASS